MEACLINGDDTSPQNEIFYENLDQHQYRCETQHLVLLSFSLAKLQVHNLFYLRHTALAPMMTLNAFFKEYGTSFPVLVGAFTIALVTSQVVYNRLFHPLADVPGPFLASVTEL